MAFIAERRTAQNRRQNQSQQRAGKSERPRPAAHNRDHHRKSISTACRCDIAYGTVAQAQLRYCPDHIYGGVVKSENTDSGGAYPHSHQLDTHDTAQYGCRLHTAEQPHGLDDLTRQLAAWFCYSPHLSQSCGSSFLRSSRISKWSTERLLSDGSA